MVDAYLAFLDDDGLCTLSTAARAIDAPQGLFFEWLRERQFCFDPAGISAAAGGPPAGRAPQGEDGPSRLRAPPGADHGDPVGGWVWLRQRWAVGPGKVLALQAAVAAKQGHLPAGASEPAQLIRSQAPHRYPWAGPPPARPAPRPPHFRRPPWPTPPAPSSTTRSSRPRSLARRRPGAGRARRQRRPRPGGGAVLRGARPHRSGGLRTPVGGQSRRGARREPAHPPPVAERRGQPERPDDGLGAGMGPPDGGRRPRRGRGAGPRG